MSARVLSLDIETAPLRSYTWGLWKQNIGLNMIDRDWYMLTWAAKWLNQPTIMGDSQYNYANYTAGSEDDEAIVKSVWLLLDEADIVIGHNAKRFDVPKMNARFLKWGLKPPSPYKIIDTLMTAKAAFKLTSNKLAYLATYLKVGMKMDTGGFELWDGCMKGDKKSWDHMLDYNKMDVEVLEKVYLILRPWMTNHPNVNLYDDDDEAIRCPKCGSTHLHSRGTYKTNVGVYKRFSCTDLECGGWARERVMTPAFKKGKRKSILTNAAA